MAWALGRPALAQVDDEGRAAMAGAATALLSALGADDRRRAVFAFGDKERLNWGYVPRRREGLALKDMAGPVRAAAHALMKASLSELGYAKAVDVMRLEGVLRQLETFGALTRDPDNYAVSVFGTPGPGAPWGWRLEGHHLSLNFTLVPGKPVAVTPAFVGANPAEVRTGALAGLRVLGREEDLARALARGLDESQRQRMVIAARSLGDIVAGPGRGESLAAAPAGVPAADLSPAQREALVRLVEAYARTMRAEVADAELRRLREAGLERVHFAWAGPLEGGAYYYRIHGPTLLIELDNTQNDANHVHSVWHDPRNDFGADVLRAHYEHGHPHHG